MIRAVLMVAFQFDKDSDGNAREENWGEFDFAAVPTPGTSIRLIRDRMNESVVVRHVTHFAVQHPLPHSEAPSLQRKTPAILIFADFSGL